MRSEALRTSRCRAPQEWPSPPAYTPRRRFTPLLFGNGLERVTVAGGGTVDGGGKHWYAKSAAELSMAPAGVLHLVNVKNLVVRDVKFVNSPKFAARGRNPPPPPTPTHTPTRRCAVRAECYGVRRAACGRCGRSSARGC